MLNAPNRTWHDRRWKGEARNALYIMVLSRTSHKCIKYCMTNIRAQKAHKQTHSNLTKSYRAYMYISNIICETLRKRNQTTSHQTSPLLASAEKATAARQPLFPKEYLYEMPCSWPFCYFSLGVQISSNIASKSQPLQTTVVSKAVKTVQKTHLS